MQNKKMLIFFSLMVLLSLSAFPTLTTAQEIVPISYGESVIGDITNEVYEDIYQFKGQEGDFVRINMTPTDILSDMDNPRVVLQTESGIELAADDYFGIGGDLFAELPDTGLYNIIATRRDGATGESVGEYSLSLSHLEVIEEDFTQTGLTATTDEELFWVVKPPSNVTLAFSNASGDMVTQFALNEINAEDGRIRELAVVGGSNALAGSITIRPALYYILSVTRAPFSFSSNTSITFDLSVTFE